MTTYYTLASSGSWVDASTWANGSAPGANDGVILDLSGGGEADIVPYFELSGISVSAASVNIFAGNTLSINVSWLSVAGTVAVTAGGAISMEGESISAGSFINSGTLSGIGSVDTSGAFQNYGTINAGEFDELVGADGLYISAKSFYNSGTITVSDASWTHIHATTFLNYSQGELIGGTYEVASGGHLYLETPGTVTRLDATVVLDNINGDPTATVLTTGGDTVALQDSLTSIAPAGSLTLQGGDYASGNAVTVDGVLAINGSGMFSAPALTIGSDGLVTYAGEAQGDAIAVTAGSIVNNGVIVVESGADLIIGALSGNGYVVDGPGGGLRLEGATSNGLVFSGSGVVVIDAPKSFTGTIAQFVQGDTLQLTGITLASVSAYHYDTTSTSGTGELTIALTDGSSVALNFAGAGYTTADFKLSNGAGTTPNLVITESGSAGSALYAANLAVQSFTAGVLTGPVSVGDSPTQVATWLDGLEKMALAGKLGSIGLSGSLDPVLTITQQQASHDVDALNLIVGPHEVHIVGATTT